MMIERGTGTLDGYVGYTRRKTAFLAAVTIGLAALAVFTIKLGASDLSVLEILGHLVSPDDSWDSYVVWDLRLLPILAAVAAGAALGIAGCVMQSTLRNPLASPFTLGLSNAAAFGAALAILFMDAGTFSSIASDGASVDNGLLTTALAFAFAMLATGVMLLMIKLTDCTPETIVLAGMAVSSVFSAGLAFLQYMASDVTLSGIVYWQFGSVSKVGWTQLAAIVAVLLAISLYYVYRRWDLNALEAGEDVARGLGVNIRATRLTVLVLAAVLTAAVVSFMGVIGFIGLVGPHIVKRLIGNDNRFVLVGSMLVGALVLLLPYVVGTYAFEITIPVGIITSAIGGPLFIAILLSGRRRRSPA